MINLTLTSVVFESWCNCPDWHHFNNLTLTSVVFEYAIDRCYTKDISNLTLTSVVFEFVHTSVVSRVCKI